MNKLQKLRELIGRYNRIAVAYSGGVDSTFLLYFTKIVLGKEVIAFTGLSETFTIEEMEFARAFTDSHKIKHIVIRTSEFKDKRFLENSKYRCFYCKSELFDKIKSLKKRYNFEVVFDGTNYSDKNDFRPGRLARDRYNVLSPLEIAGLTKEDIRKYSKRYKIVGYNRPPNACLASRIPFGISIENQIIRKIAIIERFLKSLGLSIVRLRHHNEIARIETEPEDLKKILLNRDKIIKKLKQMGYRYITLDIEGYRTGSLNI